MGLIEDVRAAREAGMNYGVWKSKQPVVLCAPPSKPYVRKCLGCGYPLRPKQNEFCSKECRVEYLRDLAMEAF